MEAKIFNHRAWITEIDSKKLHPKFHNLLERSGFTVIKYIEHYFEPYGYTALYLLAESHFAIHTFPEESKTYIELSSCSKQLFDRFMGNLTNA